LTSVTARNWPGSNQSTVNKHLEQIYAKLGVENRASAAVPAIVLAIRVTDAR
jgi:DNA-binding NarL/FixJ family response regulator